MLSHFLLAIGFLTRIPVPHTRRFEENDLAKAAAFFPVVGALIGLLGWGFVHLVHPFASADLCIVLLMSFSMLLTGAFHEDAVADAFDAFGSQWTKERILDVMKDSRIGTYGTLAVVMMTLLKFIMLRDIGVANIGPVFVVAHILSRWISLPMLCCLPYPKGSAGMGKAFVEGLATISWRAVIPGTLFALFVAVFAFGMTGLYFMLGVSVVGLLSGLYYYRKLQGATGDCLGTTTLLSELVIYFMAIHSA
jgi:adenosylcobinamide-GDP ribazoletransferase